MSDIIHLLPDHVANQIAAGEVVQRPASIVKELLENAIDAKATHIHLIVKDAGKTLVQVIDNGSGMSETDARMCFERHATSKITKAEDLFNLATKGFRGEAMASIAAIAQVVLKTKKADQELGTFIQIEGSKITDQQIVHTPTGTNTAVKNIFFNIPARRNFLKSDTIEMKHIIDEFLRVALVHHSISFVLNHNNQELYNLPVGNLKQRIVTIFGSKTNERLIPVSETTDVVSVEGFIIKPEFSKKKRGEQFFFVNDRYIKSQYLHHAVNSAFEGLIDHNNYPGYFLYLTVPNHTIDINIHPTKTEVKFENEQILYEIIRAAVKHSLGQFNITPTLDFTLDPNLVTPYHYKNKTITETPQITIDPTFNPFSTQSQTSGAQRYKSYSSGSSAKTPVYSVDKLQWADAFENIEVIIDKPEIGTSPLLTESITNVQTDCIQLFNKYIIASTPIGYLMINQHLAHQRILYEQFLLQFSLHQSTCQHLLFPIKISVTVPEMLIIKNLQESLETAGFVFDDITNDTLVIAGMPAHMAENQIVSVFETLIQDFEKELQHQSFSSLDAISKSLAKSLAIKNGKKLKTEELNGLIVDLMQCKEYQISPLGKKIYTIIDSKKIDFIFNND